MFESICKLRYSPKLIGGRNEKWWLIADADKDLGRYYRTLFAFGNYKTKMLGKPSWAEHITVIRDEEPSDSKKIFWDKYDGLEVKFKYSPVIFDNAEYYWLDVECPFFDEIRNELGLPQPLYPYHVTIGNVAGIAI